MRSIFRVVGRQVLLFSLKTLSKNEKEGVKLAFRFMLRHPLTLTVMLITGLAAAVFEGGTLGILGFAVSVLTGSSGEIPTELSSVINNQVEKYFNTVSTGGVFLTLIGVAVIAQMVKGALTYISTVAQIRLSFGMQGDAQDKATHHVMNMNYADVSSYPSGKLVSLVEQAGIVSNVVSEVGKASRALLMVVSYVSVMLLMSWKMTLSSILIFSVLLFSFNRLVSAIKNLSRSTFWGQVDTTRWAVEFIGVPRLVRIFGSSIQAEETIKEARYRRISADRRSATLVAVVIPAFEIVTVFGAGLFLVIGYLLAGESAIEVVPKLFVFVLVFFRLKPQVKGLNDLRISVVKLLPQLEIIGDFLREKTTRYERVGGADFKGLQKDIVFHDVSLSYQKTNNYAVQNLKFSINRGETIGVVGQSGSGKSTIVNLLLELYKPDSGEILIDGSKLDSLDLEKWRRYIGVVDQDVMLLNTTIEKNISFGRLDLDNTAVKSAARVAHAHDFISKLDHGYETVIGDRGFMLSGGQKQRIALARAIARKPDILILDEATSALDSISEGLIQTAIEDMHKKCTILVIAHRLATVSKSDRIMVLDEGKIIECGTHIELLQKGGKYARLWKLQSGTSY